jgi:hypothetical protein
MMKHMSFHPVAPGPVSKSVSKTGFGFDAIMENPDYGRFLDWYHANSHFSPRRDEVMAVFSEPEDADFDEAA